MFLNLYSICMIRFVFERTPFGIHNVLVYNAIVLLEYGTWYFIVETIFCAFGFLVALCKMVSMFLKDLKADWHTLNQINKTGFYRKVKMKFCALVGVHSQILQLVMLGLIKFFWPLFSNCVLIRDFVEPILCLGLHMK